MTDHRDYISGIVVKVMPNQIRVTTSYDFPGLWEQIPVEKLLIDAAGKLAFENGTPIAVLFGENEDEPTTQK